MILVSSCWEKNFICNNARNFFILYLVFLKLLIVSVAFFLGHLVSLHLMTLITNLFLHDCICLFNIDDNRRGNVELWLVRLAPHSYLTSLQ